MEKYRVLGTVGEGVHGVVVKSILRENGKLVALKKILLKNTDSVIPLSTLREIRSLQQLDHENIVSLQEVFAYGASIILVLDYMPTDLSVLIHNPDIKLELPHLKRYMLMLLNGISYCHGIGLVHRDLKPANLLIDFDGSLKIGDFGQARIIDKSENATYSHQVATRWYRAPELLFGAQKYTSAVDLWAIGCIVAEMFNRFPLFRGENDIEQLCLVFRAFGKPSEEIWPGVSSLPDFSKIVFPDYPVTAMEVLVPDTPTDVLDFIAGFLVYNPPDRMSAEQALSHPVFFSDPLQCCLCSLPKPKESHGYQSNLSYSQLFSPSSGDIVKMLKKVVI